MNQLTNNKINNYHHKTSSYYISKQKLEKNMTSSTGLLKSNGMCIKINKISNSNEGLIYMMNPKVANGKSFDKDLQEKKNIKNFIKHKKIQKNKDSEKNSIELESKDEISTNNLTENFCNNANNNYTEHKNNGNNNNLNIKIRDINFYSDSNANLSEPAIKNLIDGTNINISKVITNLNLRNGNNAKRPKKVENNENNIKNGEDKKQIKVNIKNKKGLHPNISNTGRKSLNLNFNSGHKRINIAKRKYSNLTEDNKNMGIGGLIPLKSRTQNYINLNINNFNSNHILKGSSKIVNDAFNKSCENNKISNNLLSSKKKLFSENIDNNNIQKMKVNQGNKKIIRINNIKFEQKNSLLLTDIFSSTITDIEFEIV